MCWMQKAISFASREPKEDSHNDILAFVEDIWQNVKRFDSFTVRISAILIIHWN
jgi:hypothetical protein